MAKRAKKSEGPTKAQQIRDLAKSMGKKIRPRDIVAALKEKGVTVTPAQVSTTLKAAGYRRKRRKNTVANGAPAPVASNGLTLGALIAAKELIHKAGGVKAAEAAIQAMKKLG